MPFLKDGAQGLIYTKKYLEAGRLIFKNHVKIFTMNHIPDSEISDGANKFLIWKIPQMQFKNPNLQIVTFKNMTPSPFIKCYLENSEEILIDVSFRDVSAIENHLLKILGKGKEILQEEKFQNQVILNPANFGRKYPRQCMCEILGQVPCPSKAGPPVPFSEKLEGKCNFDNEIV